MAGAHLDPSDESSYADLVNDLTRDLLLGIDGMPVANVKPPVGSGLVWSGTAWVPQGSALPGVIDEWIPLTGFTNGWTASVSDPPAVMKDTVGVVHFKGLISPGASASAAFTLAAGFRPVQTDYWATLVGTVVSGGYVEISAAGVVTPNYTSGASGNYLASISYPAAS